MTKDKVDNLMTRISVLSKESKKSGRGETLSPKYPSSDLEKRLGEAAVQEKERALEMRDNMYTFLKWFLVVQSLVILSLVVLQGFGVGGFYLNDIIFYILVGGLPAEVYLLVKIVCEYLFPRE